MQDNAIENIRIIRETMERATSFTAVPGKGTMLIGASAILTSIIASFISSPTAWLICWVIDAIFAISIGVVMMNRKAENAGLPLLSGPGKRFIVSLCIPLVSGLILTILFYQNGLIQFLPGLWLLLYGAGVITGGMFSVRIVPIMGGCFMALGFFALFIEPYAPWFMAIGFGALHIIFGQIIAKNYGG